MQPHKGHGRTEHQRAVHQTLERWRLFHRKQQGDQGVKQEEAHQEGLHRIEKCGLIKLRAPDRANAEGEDETQPVEKAPAPVKGDQRDAQVQYQIIGKQADVIAGTGRRQHRGQKAPGDAHGGEPDGVLNHREGSGGNHHQQQQAEGCCGCQQLMELESGKNGEIDQPGRAALHHQPISCVFAPEPPAENQHHQRSSQYAGIAQLQRHHDFFGGVLQQKGHTEEQNEDPDPHHQVAAGKVTHHPLASLIEYFIQPAFNSRFWRRLPRLGCSSPGVFDRFRMKFQLERHVFCFDAGGGRALGSRRGFPCSQRLGCRRRSRCGFNRSVSLSGACQLGRQRLNLIVLAADFLLQADD